MKGFFYALAAACALPAAGRAAEGFTEFELRGNDQLRYRVFAPKAETTPDKIVVFIPGGDGSDAFTPWLLSLYRNAMPEDVLAVQLIAPKWGEGQQVVWPTRMTPSPKMGEPVEDFFEAVVRKVAKEHGLRRPEVYTFSWSSGGVPAYVIAADRRAGVKGSFVAMAVYRETWLPKSLKKVRKQRFFLYQSPEDTVTPYPSAEEGKASLEENGAEVRLKSYGGGHGWAQGTGHFPDVLEGMEWIMRKE